MRAVQKTVVVPSQDEVSIFVSEGVVTISQPDTSGNGMDVDLTIHVKYLPALIAALQHVADECAQ